jgi:hypothetical protein
VQTDSKRALPRLRQAVVAAADLDSLTAALRSELGLGEPFSDPGVAYFGLRNAVFALGDTFLEVVSPVRDDAAAMRLLARRGGDCGYMTMFQVDDLPGARERAHLLGIREVFEVSLSDIDEVHLHPADIGAAIVSLSSPRPPDSWRWGGPNWEQRSTSELRIVGAQVAVQDPDAVAERWRTVIGGDAGIEYVEDPSDLGLVEVRLAGRAPRQLVELGGVRFTFAEHAPAGQA